jgi:hypothetical protein
MNLTAIAALDRTVRLLNTDFFLDPVSPEAVVEGLLSTTVRIESDRENLASPSGQTLLAALVGQIAMMGIGIDLHIPAGVPILEPQPPLRGTDLLTALVEYGRDLVPDLRIGPDLGSPHLTFVLGSTRSQAGRGLRVYGTDETACVEPIGASTGAVWQSAWPMGALAAAGAAAPEALRVALRRIAQNANIELAATYSYDTDRVISVDLSLPHGMPAEIDAGRVDFISGGAITTSAIYALLRFPIRGAVRVIEPDTLDVSNMNRYPLMRRSDCGAPKVAMLSRYSRSGFSITGQPLRFDMESTSMIGVLAPTVFVGVDDIPSRWAVQRLTPEWLCVGATSHLFIVVSTHEPGQACAGCVHPRDDEGVVPIPTISFASFWAGLLQARSLLAHLSNCVERQSVYCYSFGLASRRAVARVDASPTADCPVGCLASITHAAEMEVQE